MSLNIDNKKIRRFVIINIILSFILLTLSSYMYSFVAYEFEADVFPILYKIISIIGKWFSYYLISPGLLLPETIQYSFLGGPLSYLSAFVMTTPITFLFIWLFRKCKKFVFKK